MKILVVVLIGSSATTAAPPGWGIIQLTDNNYDDYFPEISGSNVVLPDVVFPLVEALEARGEAKAGLVDDIDGVVEVFGPHHGEDRAEELGQMGVASGRDVPLDPG